MPVSRWVKTPVLAAVESLFQAYESTLAEGLKVERRLFHGLFATKDQKEGKQGNNLLSPPCSDVAVQVWRRSRRRGSPTSHISEPPHQHLLA